MSNFGSINLYNKLCLIIDKRKKFNLGNIIDFASAYNLKRNFVIKASSEILDNYSKTISRNHIPKSPLYDPNGFDFEDPITQVTYWIDSLLHNCRGALETLSQIVNYVYQLGLKLTDVNFNKIIEHLESTSIGITHILKDIQSDAWFKIITKLRNRAYHEVINTFVPKIGIGGKNPVRYTIRFPINPIEGNLSHENLELFLAFGKCKMASMELHEFTNFIVVRLEEYLTQIDSVISEDCIDISENRIPRSNSIFPRLSISLMKLNSWRNLFNVDDLHFPSQENDNDLE